MKPKREGQAAIRLACGWFEVYTPGGRYLGLTDSFPAAERWLKRRPEGVDYLIVFRPAGSVGGEDGGEDGGAAGRPRFPAKWFLARTKGPARAPDYITVLRPRRSRPKSE